MYILPEWKKKVLQRPYMLSSRTFAHSGFLVLAILNRAINVCPEAAH